MEIFLYYFFLIFMSIMIVNLMYEVYKWCPKKISFIINIMMILFVVRTISLLFMSITDSNNYALIVGKLSRLNIVYIPSCIFVILYIFKRDNKTRFTTVYPYILMFSSLFIADIYLSKFNLKIVKQFGFVIFSSNDIIENFVFITIVVFLMILAIKSITDQRCNKLGINLVIISSLSMVIERFMIIYQVNIFPLPLIGELIFLISLYYTVYKFKKI